MHATSTQKLNATTLPRLKVQGRKIVFSFYNNLDPKDQYGILSADATHILRIFLSGNMFVDLTQYRIDSQI